MSHFPVSFPNHYQPHQFDKPEYGQAELARRQKQEDFLLRKRESSKDDQRYRPSPSHVVPSANLTKEEEQELYLAAGSEPSRSLRGRIHSSPISGSSTGTKIVAVALIVMLAPGSFGTPQTGSQGIDGLCRQLGQLGLHSPEQTDQGSHAALGYPVDSMFSRFTMSLSDLIQRGVSVHDVREAIAAREKLDPLPPSPPTVKPKFARSLVELPEQHLLLSPLPKDLEDGASYLELCLNKGVRVMISAHEFSDATKKQNCPNFWNQTVASMVQGWNVRVESEKVLQEGTMRNLRGEMPKVDETTLVATSPSGEQWVLTNLHYTAWVDRSGNAPDEPLLQATLDRAKQLSPNPWSPIAVNCKAGKGRTSVIALSLVVRSIIDEAIYRQTDHEGVINIAQLLRNIRLKRPQLMGKELNEAHLQEVISMSKEYYDRQMQILTSSDAGTCAV